MPQTSKLYTLFFLDFVIFKNEVDGERGVAEKYN
jgi:hypothetical protein